MEPSDVGIGPRAGLGVQTMGNRHRKQRRIDPSAERRVRLDFLDLKSCAGVASVRIVCKNARS